MTPLEKLPTGLPGFDFATEGGLPVGRSCLVAGTSGTGKTVFAVQFLVAGIEAGQPGVFVTFEETPEDIRRNVQSFGWQIAEQEEAGRWAFVDVSPDPEVAPAVVAGDYDLDALISRILYAVDRVEAQRVAIDSIGSLFGQFEDQRIVRRELLRIATALKQRGLTVVLTAERLDETGSVSRYDVEEFVTDSVVVLRNRLESGRRRRTVEILKMRGAPHAKGEYPFSILAEEGFVVIPLSAIDLEQQASEERYSSGVEALDVMCGGGFFGNSGVLVSGATGTGKTLMAAHFVSAVAPGEMALLLAFEEGRQQIIRNARGWSIDLGAMVQNGSLHIECRYPEALDLEDHLLAIKRLIDRKNPKRVALDSLSALERVASQKSFREFVIALTAFLKRRGVMMLMTTTTPTHAGYASTVTTHVSTITDGIILLRHIELYGEMRRAIAVLKMRGSAHDKQIREMRVTDTGLQIGEPIRNVAGVVSGNLSYIMDDQIGFTPMIVPGRLDTHE